MTTNNTNEKIGLATATIISMNAMIGAGIFSTPAKFALSVGPAGLITYAFVILAVLFMALAIAKVAQLYPQEGAFYTYTKPWGGHTMGVLASGAYAAGIAIALGLLTKLAAIYLNKYFPAISINTFGLLLVTTVVSLNVIGVKIMQVGQYFLLACTLFALISTTIFGFTHIDVNNLTPFMPNGLPSLLTAIPVAIFAFFGFESSTALFNIVKKPEVNVPKAIVYSILVVGSVYLAFISSIILSIPRNAFLSAETPLSQAIMTTYPNYSWLANAIGIAILTAFLGVLQSLTYSVSTLIYTFIHLVNKKSTISKSWVIIGVGLATLFNFFVLKKIGLFFCLTAIFLVFAYACAIVTLLKVKKNRILAILGLATAALIFGSAIMELVKELA